MEPINKNAIVNQAGMAGAAFGTISAAWVFISILMSSSPALSILSSILSIGKTVGLVFLMIFFMKKLVRDFDGVTNYDTRSYGRWIALFSAIITGIATYIAYEFAFPDFVTKTMDTVYQSLGSALDLNSRGLLEKYENNFGLVACFSTMLWCLIYGLILGAIVSARIPRQDPFERFRRQEETTDEQ